MKLTRILDDVTFCAFAPLHISCLFVGYAAGMEWSGLAWGFRCATRRAEGRS